MATFDTSVSKITIKSGRAEGRAEEFESSYPGNYLSGYFLTVPVCVWQVKGVRAGEGAELAARMRIRVYSDTFFSVFGLFYFR